MRHAPGRPAMETVRRKVGGHMDSFFGSKLALGGFLLQYEVFESPPYRYPRPQDALRHDVERVAQDFWGAAKVHDEQFVASG